MARRQPERRSERNPRRRPARHADLRAPVPTWDEDQLIEAVARTSAPPLLLVLDCVQDPHNLGACLRTADAAGAMAVVAPKDKSAGLTETVRRVASGAAEHVPFVQVTNLARALRRLKDAGVWIAGTSDSAAADIHELDWTGPTAIVMGAEGGGLRRLTAEHCDFLARIPMIGHVECLNVSVAAGVCLFEAVRQRRGREGNERDAPS